MVTKANKPDEVISYLMPSLSRNVAASASMMEDALAPEWRHMDRYSFVRKEQGHDNSNSMLFRHLISAVTATRLYFRLNLVEP